MSQGKLENQLKAARFLLSAPEFKHLPSDLGAEIAFLGRSNVGKSSALNVITQNKQLARTSKTPGRTQAMNVFALTEKHRLVDLPGYGYAKVNAAVQKRWRIELERYLVERQSLIGIILLMDSRHPLKSLDEVVLQWGMQVNMPIHILLTKSDKLNNSEKSLCLREIKNHVKQYSNPISIQLFSALKQQGRRDVISVIAGWFAEYE